MTRDQIQAIFARVLTWPKERQEDVARILLKMEEGRSAPYIPDEEDLADLDAAEAEIQRGEPPASDEEVRAFFDGVRRA